MSEHEALVKGFENFDKQIGTLIENTTPERSSELSGLWSKYSGPLFVRQSDDAEFSLENKFFLSASGYGRIYFNYRSLMMLWLLGFVAQKIFEQKGGIIYWCQTHSLYYDPDLFLKKEDQLYFSDMIKRIEDLKCDDSFDKANWPQDVPFPEDVLPPDYGLYLAFDLICMSSAFLFLHEVKHEMIREEGKTLDAWSEEYECDRYAEVFLLDKVGILADQQGYPKEVLAAKRSMSIAFAFFFILIITPPENRGGTFSHPHAGKRLRAFIDRLEINSNIFFWHYLASLLTAFIQQFSIPSEIILPHTTSRQVCMVLIDKIINHYPEFVLGETKQEEGCEV
jgi:hypothetical protein